MVRKVSRHISQNEGLIFEGSSPGKYAYQLPEAQGWVKSLQLMEDYNFIIKAILTVSNLGNINSIWNHRNIVRDDIFFNVRYSHMAAVNIDKRNGSVS